MNIADAWAGVSQSVRRWGREAVDVPALRIDTREDVRGTWVLGAWSGWPNLEAVPTNSASAELTFQVTFSYCAKPPIEHVRMMVSKEAWGRLGEEGRAGAGVMIGCYSIMGPNYRRREMTFTTVISPCYSPNKHCAFDYDLVLGPLRCASSTTTLSGTSWTRTFEFMTMSCSLAHYNDFFL